MTGNIATNIIRLLIAILIASCGNDVAYHRSKMNESRQEMFIKTQEEGGLTGYKIDFNQQEKYHRHRQWLINNNNIFVKTYVFENISSATERSAAIKRDLLRSPPAPMVDFSSPHKEGFALEITLWAEQSDKEMWDNYMKSWDITVITDGEETP